MAIPWGLIVIVLGFAYGALKPGRQPKGKLLLQGLLLGVVLAILIGALSFLTHQPVFEIAGIAVGLAIVIAAFVLSLLFVLGVWLGDLVTPSSRRRAA
jgi:heme A synthase